MGSRTLQEALKKATDWSGTKIGTSSKETRHSWYQSIDKKHIWTMLNFMAGYLFHSEEI
jgi:hypothetical protein